MRVGRGPRAGRDVAEFLPAALEIESSPASPLGRVVALCIALLFVCALAWATVGQVDVVAIARGRLIPAGHSRVVQPLEAGIVRVIHVRDGQPVRRGDALVDLDPTSREAEHDRLRHEHRAAQLHVARLRALLAAEPALTAPAGAPAGLVALQQRVLADQRAELGSRLEAARLQVEQRRAGVEAARADVRRLEAIVPLLTERAEAFRTLLAGEYVARLQYLEVEQDRLSRVQELAAQRERLAREIAAAAEAAEQMRLVQVEFTRARQSELADWEVRAALLEHDMAKAAQASRVQRLSAPVDGVVQQLAVHTIGGVVTPAQPVLVVVPTGEPVEVEAWIENKDAAFVRPGQPVEVKADSLPFTRYGTVGGEVLTVSRDAVAQERGGLAYLARVRLARASVATEEGEIALAPGMLVTVEIATGRRRLIEFLVSPLLRGWREAARER